MKPILAVITALLLAPLAALHAAEFPLRDGDTWLMLGDSLTQQHLHSNYIEAFCYARYPRLKFRFRNSGYGGDTVAKVLARFDQSIAPWRPTVISVELGLNDIPQRVTVEQFIANMETLCTRIKAVPARAVLFTFSPYNSGDPCTGMFPYADALKRLADRQNIPFADQFHPLVKIWPANKERENVARALEILRTSKLLKDDSVPGIRDLNAFLDAQEKSATPFVSMQGNDTVHVGPNGQLMMAAALLKGLGASGFVSHAVLTAQGAVTEANGCVVSGIKVQNGGIGFDRLDDASPFPIPDGSREMLKFDPTILELSEYNLKVTGLTAGQFVLKIDGEELGTVSAKELAQGINLTTFAHGPIAAQGKAILAAVAAKEALVGLWGSKPDIAKVEAADAAIRAAAQPEKLRFEIVPVK